MNFPLPGQLSLLSGCCGGFASQTIGGGCMPQSPCSRQHPATCGGYAPQLGCPTYDCFQSCCNTGQTVCNNFMNYNPYQTCY